MEPVPVADLIGTGSKRAPDLVPVAFVSSHARRGGSERYLALLLEHLDPACISTVVCLRRAHSWTSCGRRHFRSR